MKILFVLGFPNPFAGAGFTRIGFFSEAWSKQGCSVEVLGTYTFNTLQKRGAWKIGRVNLFNAIFRVEVDLPLMFLFNSLTSILVTTVFLLARKPTVAVVSVPPGDIGLGTLIACRLLKIKHLIDYRDEWEDYATSRANHRIDKFFYSIVRKVADCIYAKSQLVITATPNFREVLKQRGVINVELVPNGADIKIFKKSNIKKKNRNFTMFYSGHIGTYYNLEVILKSLRKLVDLKMSNIKLTIAGRGEIDKVINLARELGISNNVEYKGEINDKMKLARLIAEADVGLIPYDDCQYCKNSVPAKFFEYSACGVPVIATTQEDSMLAGLITKYKVGLISPPRNVEMLTEAIHSTYQNEAFREAAGMRAIALVEKEFDRNKIAKEFLNIIQNFCVSSNKE